MKHLLYDKSTGLIRNVMNGFSDERAATQETGELAVISVNDLPDNLRQWVVVEGVLTLRVVPDDEQREIVQRHIRVKRFSLLKQSDWTQVPDAPFDAVKRKAWRDYRQALRDLPNTYQNETDPANIVWPVPPGEP